MAGDGLRGKKREVGHTSMTKKQLVYVNFVSLLLLLVRSTVLVDLCTTVGGREIKSQERKVLID